MQLHQILDESCLFTDYKKIILFFYVNDIVILFPIYRKSNVETLVQKLYSRFKLRDMKQLIFFLDIRVIRNNDDIYLCQNSYMNKLIIEYQIDTFKSFSTSLSIDFIVSTSLSTDVNISTSNSISNLKVDLSRRQKYRKKIEFIYYSTNITRSNVIKTVSKLTKHLINSSSKHLHATNYCL